MCIRLSCLASDQRRRGEAEVTKGFAVASALLAVVSVGIDRGSAAVLVGETHHQQPSARPTSDTEKLKAEYRRPHTIQFPKDNPYTPEKASLGKMLYFDTRLSGGKVLSCATCHNPGFGWGDGLPKGVGHGMKELGRRSPTVINAAWGQIFFWDGRAASLEEQALGPIQSEGEMNMPLGQLKERIAAIHEYKALFEGAFPGEAMAPVLLAKAIATYERTVVSNPSPFDAWVEGQESAIPDEAKRGFALFNGKARCSSCHVSWTFTDDSFHDIGLPSEDIGRGKFLTGVLKAQHAFKTPGLREITRRAPYMHDGSLLTLEAVIDHYDRGGEDRPSRSDLIKPLGLSAQEKLDLVAFLKTLTSDVDPTTVPVLPR
jgi:cytochrome c peroxidase